MTGPSRLEDFTVYYGRKLVGLDIGTRRIGVAISDEAWQWAHPRVILRRTGSVAGRWDLGPLGEICRKEQVAALIAGEPLEMDGRPGSRVQGTRDRMGSLSETLGLPWAFFDERLSTAAVLRVFSEDPRLSFQRRARRLDSAAAAVILEGALQFLCRLREETAPL